MARCYKDKRISEWTQQSGCFLRARCVLTSRLLLQQEVLVCWGWLVMAAPVSRWSASPVPVGTMTCWQALVPLGKRAVNTIHIVVITKGPTFTPSSTALMTLVTDATFSLSSKSMPSSITWSAQRMRLARLWYTRLWQEDSAELRRQENMVRDRERCNETTQGDDEGHRKKLKPCTPIYLASITAYSKTFGRLRTCKTTDTLMWTVEKKKLHTGDWGVTTQKIRVLFLPAVNGTFRSKTRVCPGPVPTCCHWFTVLEYPFTTSAKLSPMLSAKQLSLLSLAEQKSFEK